MKDEETPNTDPISDTITKVHTRKGKKEAIHKRFWRIAIVKALAMSVEIYRQRMLANVIRPLGWRGKPLLSPGGKRTKSAGTV